MFEIQKILEILRYRNKTNLAQLLSDSEYDFTYSTSYGSRWNSTLTTADIYSPIKNHDELLKLSEEEQEDIIKAFHVIYPVKDEEIEVHRIEFFVHPDKPILESELSTLKQNDAETNYWDKNHYRLFISHSSIIKKDANDLKNELSQYAISAFVAHDDITPTKEWQLVIEDALLTCDDVVAMLNEDFPDSKWTDQEIGICYGLGKTIIPLRLGVDPYGFMGKFQGLNCKGKSIVSIAENIYKLLLIQKNSKEKISRFIIEKFVNSGSFSEAKDNCVLLEEITYIDEKLMNKIKSAKENNGQIARSFGVPQKVDAFLNVWAKKSSK